MRDCDFSKAHLERSDFRGAKLMGSTFKDAFLDGILIDSCHLRAVNPYIRDSKL